MWEQLRGKKIDSLDCCHIYPFCVRYLSLFSLCKKPLGDGDTGWAKTRGNLSLFVGKAVLKALLGGAGKEQQYCKGCRNGSLSMLSLTDHQNKVEMRREKGRWKQRGVGSCCIPLLTFFFFLDDSYFSVFRQEQQVFPKHVMDPWSSRQRGLGLAETQGKAEGKGLPCWEAIGYS